MDVPHRPPTPGPHVPRPPWETAAHGQPPRHPPPPPAPRRPRARTWLVATLVLALLTWLAGVASFGHAAGQLPATAASEFVPDDAHRALALYTNRGQQSQAMVESSRVRGLFLPWSLSPKMVEAMVPPPGVSPEAVDRVRWWREAVIPASTAETARYRLFSITDAGIRFHGQDWGQLGVTFDPAPLWLPADVQPGAEWTERGIAGADVSYRMTGKVEAPPQEAMAGDGCVQVTTTMQLVTQGTGAADIRWAERNLWCPGKGVVDSSGSLGDVDYAVSTAKGKPADPLPDNARAQTPDPAGIPSWQHRPLDAIGGDQTFGSQPLQVTAEDDPVVSAPAPGSIVFRAGPTTDLVGLLPVQSGKHWMHWWVRPGGQVLSLAAFGRTVVATTSDRRMMAYLPGGRLLWSVTLDDVAHAPPVQVSDDRLVVASTRGVVSMRSAVDGRELWSRRIQHGVSHEVASDGSVVAVLDNDEKLHVLDARTGEERWTAQTGFSTNRVAVSDGTTVVAGGSVRAFDNRTGRRRWDRSIRWIDDIRVSNGTVAADSSNGVELLDLDDGSRLASFPGANQPRPLRTSWVMLDGDSLVAVDGKGARAGSWRLTASADARAVVVGPSRVWVFGRTPDGTLAGEWVGPGG